jgi:hypothetical protein
MQYASVLLLLAAALAPSQTIAVVDRAQLERDEKLLSYTVTEHYILKNLRFGTEARMIAKVTYTKDAGKTYDITERTGNAMLQSKVLDRVIAEEKEMSHGDTRKGVLITSANYEMREVGPAVMNGRDCIQLDITPRVRSSHLLKGKLWVDAASHNIVRIEGTPPISPSFFAGSPVLYRDYTDIGPFAYALKSVALSGSMLLGKSEMTIEYTGYQINVDNR